MDAVDKEALLEELHKKAFYAVPNEGACYSEIIDMLNSGKYDVAVDLGSYEVSSGIARGANERLRQLQRFPISDDVNKYSNGELTKAAIAYASANCTDVARFIWPWSADWWKPSSYSRNLEKAIALLMAEWDRVNYYKDK